MGDGGFDAHRLGAADGQGVRCDRPLAGVRVALFQLDPEEPITQKALAKRLKCNPSTVADPTDRLEEAGLVVRSANPHDRRENELVVTPKGATIRERLIARLLEPPSAFGQLSATEQARFTEILRKAVEAVAQPAP